MRRDLVVLQEFFRGLAVFSLCEHINLIMTKLVSCHRFSVKLQYTWGKLPHIFSWKRSYHCSSQNIKHCLVHCLFKSRTNKTGAKQDWSMEGCTAEKKKLYLEWNSIFLTPKCVPSSPPTLSWALGSFRHKLQGFVNGLPPYCHPRIRYSIKTWGILLWLLVSCFLYIKKNKAPSPPSLFFINTQANTMMYSTSCHTSKELLSPHGK